jgi:hypothetical protein
MFPCDKDASLCKLSCEIDVLNSCYDIGDIELLTRIGKKKKFLCMLLQNKPVFLLQAKDVNTREHA